MCCANRHADVFTAHSTSTSERVTGVGNSGRGGGGGVGGRLELSVGGGQASPWMPFG